MIYLILESIFELIYFMYVRRIENLMYYICCGKKKA